MSAFTPLTASAVVVEGLFEVEVTVLDKSKAIRRAALDDGLIEVLIKVSGDSDILEKIEAPAADSYVKRFEYSVQAPAASGGETSQRLWVRYNATKVFDFLRQQAIPIWGEHRSQAVIWLAVRDGRQRYILKQSDVSLIKEKANAAFSRRGIPAIWPENDAIDQETVHFSDIWAGFTEPLQRSSKRYSSGPVIAANMGWNGQIWSGEWSLLMGDEVMKWSLSGRDYVILVSRATDLIADAMGKKFAVLETSDILQQKTIAVEIDKVKSVEDFRRIEKYLLSLSSVQSIQLLQVEPDRMFFDLTLRSEVDDLLNLIQSGSVLALRTDDKVISEPKHETQNKLKDELIVVTDSPENTTTNVVASEVLVSSPLKPVPYRFVLR